MIKSFSNNFKKICNEFVDFPNNFVLGLSGGADSTALLYLLKTFIINNPKKLKIKNQKEIFKIGQGFREETCCTNRPCIFQQIYY